MFKFLPIISVLALAAVVTPALATDGIQVAGGSCIEYAFTESLFAPGKKDTSGRYAGDRGILKKAHVVCMGDSIHVSKPILTNGGDIVLFASTVIVDFPMDTRVYVDHSAKDVADGAVSVFALPIVERFYGVTTDALRADGKYLAGGADRFPEAPHGSTAKGHAEYSPRRCAKGNEAECGDDEYLSSSLASGNITIVMNDLRLCADCGPNDPQFPLSTNVRAACPAIPRPNQRSLFQAASIRPSRGAYSVQNCSGVDKDKPVCTQAQYTRFLGNKGGSTETELAAAYAPGQIEIVFSGRAPRAFQGKTELKELAEEVAARSNSSVLPPHTAGFAQVDQRNSCITSGGMECCLHEIAEYEARPGARGRANVQIPASDDLYFNVPNGLSTISAALETLDRQGLAKDQLAQYVADSGVATTFSPTDQLSAFLWKASIASTSAMVELTRANWPSEAENVDVRPAVFRGLLQDDAAPSGLSDYQFRIALSIVNRFSLREPNKPSRSYLENLNGLSAVEIADPKNEFHLVEASRAREEIGASLKKVIIELQKINLHNFDTVSEAQLSEMRRVVQDIERRLHDAEEYANSQGWADIAKTLGRAIKTVIDVYKNLGDGKWQETGENIASLIRDIRDLEDAARKMQSPEELRALLLAALAEQRALQAKIAESRRLLVLQIGETGKELDANVARYNDYAAHAKELSDELFRNLLIRYATDGADDPNGRLNRRLNELRRLLDEYPAHIPNFSDVEPTVQRCDTPPKDLCDSDWGSAKLKCVALPALGKPYAVRTTTAHTRLPDVPLFMAHGDIAFEQPFHSLATRDQLVLPDGICPTAIKPTTLPELQPAFTLENPSTGIGGISASIGDFVFGTDRGSPKRTLVYRWNNGTLEHQQVLEGRLPLAAGNYVLTQHRPGVSAFQRNGDRWGELASNVAIEAIMATSDTEVIGWRLIDKVKRYLAYSLPDLIQVRQLEFDGPAEECAFRYRSQLHLWEGKLLGGCHPLDGSGAVMVGLDGAAPVELFPSERHASDRFGYGIRLIGNELIAVQPGKRQIADDGAVTPLPRFLTFRHVGDSWNLVAETQVPAEVLPESVPLPNVFLAQPSLQAASPRFVVLSIGIVGVVYRRNSDDWSPVGTIPRVDAAFTDDRAIYIVARDKLNVYTFD